MVLDDSWQDGTTVGRYHDQRTIDGGAAMKRNRIWGSTLTAVALLMSSAPLLAQESTEQEKQQQDQQQNQNADQENAEQQKASPRQLQAFDLEHRTAQEIQQVLGLRWQSQALQSRTAPLDHQITPPTSQRRVAARPQLDDEQGNTDHPVFAVDNKNKVLFVRGTEEQMGEVEKLISAFDVPAHELKKQQAGDTQLIPICKENMSQVRSTLSQLQLDHKLITMGDAALVIICQDDSEDSQAQAQQIEEVIGKLKASEGLTKKAESKDQSSEEKSSDDAQDKEANSNAEESDSEQQ